MSAPARAQFPSPNHDLEFVWERPLCCDGNAILVICADLRERTSTAKIYAVLSDEEGRDELILVDEICGRCVTREKFTI